MTTRRSFFIGAGALSASGLAMTRAGAAEPEVGDDGLHKQPWLLDSFLELPDDVAEAADAGKGLAILFEQRGCPYCRELHSVNFADDRVVSALTENFAVLQRDLWGSREVVDLDGEALEERALARKWRVNFTPTTVFLPTGGKEEVFRLPGYFKPFHFVSGVEYVASGAHQTQPFQRYLQDRFAALAEQGIEPDVW